MKTWQAVARTDQHSALPIGMETGTAVAGIRTPLGQPLLFLITHLTAAWKWLEQKRTQQIAARRLKVAETVSLGEKRFVSIVEVDGAQFLIGGAAGNVSLLAVLDKAAVGASSEQPS